MPTEAKALISNFTTLVKQMALTQIKSQLPVEEVNYVGAQGGSRYDPYCNMYNLGWRDHPDFHWGGQGDKKTSSSNNIRSPLKNVVKSVTP